MTWLLPALLAPLFYALANITDNLIANRRIPNLTALLFYATFLNIAYVPIVFLLDPPLWPTGNQWFVLALIGFTNIAYLVPYYRALQTDDTSVVTALFALGKIFVPVLAFLVVGELLNPRQYVAFGLILIASIALTFRPKTRLRWSPAFPLMLLTAFIISVEVVAFKYATRDVSWGTAFAWQAIFSWLFLLPVLLLPKTRAKVFAAWPTFKQSFPLFLGMECLTFTAMALHTYAISLAPVTMVDAVVETTPFFALGVALLAKPFLPSVFREKTDRQAVFSKLLWFMVALLGIWLLAA